MSCPVCGKPLSMTTSYASYFKDGQMVRVEWEETCLDSNHVDAVWAQWGFNPETREWER